MDAYRKHWLGRASNKRWTTNICNEGVWRLTRRVGKSYEKSGTVLRRV